MSLLALVCPDCMRVRWPWHRLFVRCPRVWR